MLIAMTTSSGTTASSSVYNNRMKLHDNIFSLMSEQEFVDADNFVELDPLRARGTSATKLETEFLYNDNQMDVFRHLDSKNATYPGKFIQPVIWEVALKVCEDCICVKGNPLKVCEYHARIKWN